MKLDSATVGAGVVGLDAATATTTIGANDGTVLVSVADTTVDEGEEAEFTVTLSGTVSDDVIVGIHDLGGDGGHGVEPSE